MKKNEKNSIIIGFMLAIFLFVALILYFFYFLNPSINEIEKQKKDLLLDIKNFNNVKKKGFDFEEFKKLNSNLLLNPTDENLVIISEDVFYNKIFKNFNENFYVKYLDNKSDNIKNFGEYLNKKNDELTSIIEGKELNEKKSKISIVLPKYSNYIEISSSKGLTDLSFVNYIEKILNNFNLKTTSSIGIKDIFPVENSIIEKEDNIYYIPLNLKITGTKLSVLKFLQYIKNTGDINFRENEFIFSNKSGSTSQLSEVYNIKLNEYIDSSYKTRIFKNNSLEDFLNNTNQINDILDIEIDLRFYVSAISNERIRDKINSIIGKNLKQIIFNKDGDIKINEKTKKPEYELLHYNYFNLLNIVKKLKSNLALNSNIYYKKKVDNIFLYLNNKDLKKDFVAIKKEITKTKDINNLYKKVLKYKDLFLKLDKELYEIIKSLGLDTDKADKETGKIIQKSIYPENYIFENK